MAALAQATNGATLGPAAGDPSMSSAEQSKRQLMYIEKKDGDVDGAAGRIGWVTVSSGGASLYYRGRTLKRSPDGLRGVYVHDGTGHAYWVTPVRKTGSHAHFSPR